MLLRKPFLLFNNFSTLTTSLKWRNQIKQKQIISQVSSLLLQRHDWIPHIQNLNLTHKLTPNIFNQILRNTQNNPDISLNFFNWARTSLGFKPDLKSHYKIIQILVDSGLLKLARPLFDSVIESEPASRVLDSMVEACKGRDSQSLVCSFVLEFYSNKGLVSEGLDIFKKIRVYGYLPSTHSCNVLLDALQLKDEIRMAWCFLASIVRYGVPLDSFTWSLVARLLCKGGKLDNTVRLLNSGVYNAVIYNLIIDSYCKKGIFTNAVDLLKEMQCKNLTPGLRIYSLVLDEAYKFGDVGIVQMITREMVAKQLLPTIPIRDYNPIIQKLCELGRTYVAKVFFERALIEKSGLQNSSYGCMLRALCKEGRVKEAIRVYKMILERDVTVSHNCYRALADVICKEEPSEELDNLLKEMIGRGFMPHSSDLSNYVSVHCRQGRWKEAKDLLNVILEKRFLPDSFCCCSLVEHYCANRQVGLAVALHDKLEKLGGSLDAATYTVLLVGLFKERNIGEALRLFDYMKSRNVVSSGSFSIMITGLCCEREMRKAMAIHDEMLKMGLKPNKATYKRLISRFL